MVTAVVYSKSSLILLCFAGDEFIGVRDVGWGLDSFETFGCAVIFCYTSDDSDSSCALTSRPQDAASARQEINPCPHGAKS